MKHGITVAEAKSLNLSNIKDYIGTRVVDYKEGERWQVFYFDAEDTTTGKGKFGQANTIYLKRAYREVSLTTGLIKSDKTDDEDPAVQMMKRMNPLWASNPTISVIDNDKEKCCVWLLDPDVWKDQKNDTYSSFAIGGPSVEMFAGAFNEFYGEKYKIKYSLIQRYTNGHGYLLNNLGYTNPALYDSGCTSEYFNPDPNELFTMDAWSSWFIASPSLDKENSIFRMSKHLMGTKGLTANLWVCPIVPLDL